MDKFIIIHEAVNYGLCGAPTYLTYFVEGSDFEDDWVEPLIIDLLGIGVEEDESYEDAILQNKKLIDGRIRFKRCGYSKDPNLYTYDEYVNIGVNYHNKGWDWVVLKKSYDNEGKQYNKNDVEYKDLVEALQIDNPVVKALMDKIKYENTLHQWIMKQEEDGVGVDRELLMEYDVYIPNKEDK